MESMLYSMIMGEKSVEQPQSDGLVIIVQPSKGSMLSSPSITDVEYQQFVKRYTLAVKESSEITVRIMPCGDITPQAIMIADVLSKHSGVVTAEVPYSAGSAGTLIALACSSIVMSQCSFLSPLSHSISRLFRVSTSMVRNAVSYEQQSLSLVRPRPQVTVWSGMWNSLFNIICSYTDIAVRSHHDSITRILHRRFDTETFVTVWEFFITHAEGTPLPCEWIPECVPISHHNIT